MKKPVKYNLVKIDIWRVYWEMKRLRRKMLGMKYYGWDVN